MKTGKKLTVCSYAVSLLFVFLVLFSCDVDRSSGGIGGYAPGDTLPNDITKGTAITLPDGIVVESMTGDGTCYDGEFPMTISLSNNSSQQINVTLSAGSNFWCTNASAQNLIIVQNVTVTIPAGVNVKKCLPSYCLNSGLGAPSESDQYVLGTVYTGGCIGEIINIINTKDPGTFDYYDISIIQMAIWECMDYGSLSSDTVNELNAL